MIAQRWYLVQVFVGPMRTAKRVKSPDARGAAKEVLTRLNAYPVDILEVQVVKTGEKVHRDLWEPNAPT